jgi:hypothetical protein
MRRLLVRELDSLLGDRGPTWVALAHVTIAALFVVAWGDGRGVPLWWQHSFYAQFRLVQWVTLTVLLPWAALRSVARERRDSLLFLALLTATTPSKLLGARWIAVTIGLSLATLSGAPIAVLAQRMSGGSLIAVIHDEITLVVTTGFVGACALWAQHLWSRPLVEWLRAALVITLVLSLIRLTIPPGWPMTLGLLVVTGCVLTSLLVHADASVRYLSGVS